MMFAKLTKRTASVFVGAFLAMAFVTGCSEEKEASRSMEEIRKEEGVPVSVKEISYGGFSQKLSFYSTLKGIKESTKHSMVGDEIEAINARVGSYVKQGQIIIEFPTDNPAIQYEQAKAGYENAKRLYDRMKALHEAGETSQQNLDNAETQYLVNKRNWESVKQMVEVEAPISGYIVQMLPSVGDDWGIGKPLFTVAQIDRMKAILWVSETEVARIENGMTATIEYNGKEYEGRVSEVAMAMDQKAKAFRVEVVFPNSGRELKSGVSADVMIHTETLDSAIVLPRNLVQKSGDMNYVYIEKDGKAHLREVTIGMQQGVNVVIDSGLDIGDRIIDCCMNLLEDGIKVKVKN